MKKRLILLSLTILLVTGVALIVGCASTSIKRLPADRFIAKAQGVRWPGSFVWATYVGASHQRAYLEEGHPAFIGNGIITTVYWTPLSEFPTNLAAQIRQGRPPWTNWTENISQPAGGAYVLPEAGKTPAHP